MPINQTIFPSIPKQPTKNPERVLRLDRLGGRVREHRHHVQKVLERYLAVVGAKHLADPIAKRIHPQLRILQDLVHRQPGVLVVADLFRGEALELFVRTKREKKTWVRNQEVD